jgi:hypothetical protein
MHQARSPASGPGWAGEIKEGLPMPRFIYLLGVGLALIGLALAVTDWAMGPYPGVTYRNLSRVQPGMTVRQVEAIFGGPGVSPVWGPSPFVITEPMYWVGECGVVCVEFRQTSRRVAEVYVIRCRTYLNYIGCNPCPSPPKGFLERLRAWLGL